MYVGNLPFDTTMEDLKGYFGEYGNVEDVYIPLRDGRSRGFAFVTMSEDAADLALKETNGVDYKGRPLVVNEPLGKGESKPRKNNRQCTYFLCFMVFCGLDGFHRGGLDGTTSYSG